MKVISSGFVVKNSKDEILLGRVDRHPKPYQWTIFKGQMEESETLLDTAMRELKEETGIDIVSDHNLNRKISSNYIFTYQLSHKDVYLFLLEDENGILDNFEFKCTSYFGDNNEPEINDYKWVHIKNLADYIFPSQRGLAEFLNKKYFGQVSVWQPN